MDFESRLGEGVTVVWIGTAAALVLGTAALATLFPAIPHGVEFVMWGAALPAPVLVTWWLIREMSANDGSRSSAAR